MPHIFRQSYFRSGGNRIIRPQASAWSDRQLGYDPVTTDLVVGPPQTTNAAPGARIFRPVRTPGMTFKYLVYGKEHLRRYRTKRGPKGKIRTASFQASTETGALDRHTFASDLDELEIESAQIAEPNYDARLHANILSRMWVTLDVEADRAELLQDPSNYTNVTTLTSGNEFNGASGDMQTTLRTAARTILNAVPGATTEDIVAFMPQSTEDAAVEDTVWKAARANGGNGFLPDAAEIARYLKFKRVETGNPVAQQDDGTVAPLYPDMCLLYYESPSASFDTSRGSYLDFAIRGDRGQGGARTPFYDDSSSTFFYPWEEFTGPAITRELNAHLVLNCNKDV